MKKNVKLLGILALVATMVGCSSLTGTPEKDYELTIVHVNDVHGRAEEGQNDGVGYARVATIAKDLEKDSKNGQVLMLDAGDVLHGTTFATLNKGESMVSVLNAAGVDYMVPGNHDFNYGEARLKELMKQAKFNVLASNVVDKNTKQHIGKEYDIKVIDGVKVGFFGLATPETYFKTNPKNVENIEFIDPIVSAKETVAKLKEQGAQFIVLLSHLGDDTSTEKKYQSIGVAEAVPAINLIVDGHSHTKLDEKKVVNGVTIVQTGEYSKNVGVVKVDFDELVKGAQAIDYTLMTKDQIMGGEINGKLVIGVAEDEVVASTIKNIKDKQKAVTGVVIGSTPVKLEGDRSVVRTGESNLAQVITDAMLWKTGADVALTNGGGIRASINKGQITVGDVITVLPFGNYVITKSVKGSDLKAALEHGLRAYPESLGGFSQVAGLTVKFDPTKPEGQKVQEVKVKGKKLDMNKYYVVATNDFMAIGGDGYSSLKSGKELAHYPGLDEVLVEYIQKVGIKNREQAQKRIIPTK